jgi:hypothetical protein
MQNLFFITLYFSQQVVITVYIKIIEAVARLVLLTI